MVGLYHQFDLAFHQYRTGNMESEIYEKFEYEMPIWVSLPFGREWLARDRGRFSKSFLEFLDEKINDLPAESIPTLGRSKAGTDA